MLTWLSHGISILSVVCRHQDEIIEEAQGCMVPHRHLSQLGDHLDHFETKILGISVCKFMFMHITIYVDSCSYLSMLYYLILSICWYRQVDDK